MAESKRQNALSQEEKDEIEKWLGKQSALDPKCPACGNTHWLLGDHLVSPPIFSGGLVIGGSAYPMFMLICMKCANTLFFNAVASGLSRFNKTKEKEEKKEGQDG